MSHNQGIAQFAYGVIESLDSEDTEDGVYFLHSTALTGLLTKVTQ